LIFLQLPNGWKFDFFKIDAEREMKLIKVVAIILAITISLNLASSAHAGLWTDFKVGFKKFYSKFKKDAKTSGDAVKKDFKNFGEDAGEDARKAGADIKRDAKKMGDAISEGAESATKEIKNAFKKAKEKLE
jgi:gas vesicle protein